MKRKTTIKLRLKHTIMLALLISSFANSTFAIDPTDSRLAPPGWEYKNSTAPNSYGDVINAITYDQTNNQIFFATASKIIRDSLDWEMNFLNQNATRTITNTKEIVLKGDTDIICIANDGTISKYENRSFGLTSATPEVPTGNFSACSFVDGTDVYLGSNTGTGIAYHNNEGWDSIETGGYKVNAITKGDTRILYATENNGLRYLDNNDLHADVDMSGITHLGFYDPGNFKKLYYSTNDNLYIHPLGASTKYEYPEIIEQIGNILDIKNIGQTFYFAGSDGIAIYKDNATGDISSNTWKVHTEGFNAPISCFELLNDGTILVGTLGNGVVIIHPEINIELTVMNITQLSVDFEVMTYSMLSSDATCKFYFGDGTLDTQSDLFSTISSNKQYDTPGVYEVCAVIEDNGRIGSSCININVTNEATPCAFANFDRPFDNTGSVTITNTSSVDDETPQYLWDMGDGTTYNTENVTHTYTQNGKYTITLSASSPDKGCMSKAEQTVEIYGAAGNTKAINANFHTKVNTDTVAFINGSSGDITGYHWDFGDGFTSQGRNAIHIYENPGMYKVKLTVFNSTTKESNSTYKVVEIKDNEKRYYASFEYMDAPDITYSTITIPLVGAQTVATAIDFNALFAAKVVGSADNYMFFWDFGDGTLKNGNATIDTIKHTYATPGVYNVTLIVKSTTPGNEAYAKYTERVLIKTPSLPDNSLVNFNNFLVAKFKPFVRQNTVGVINQSIIPGALGSHFIRWDFGDGFVTSEPFPIHTYAKPGVYNITLTVSGVRGTRLLNSYTLPVRIAPATPAFMADFSYWIEGVAVEFTSNSEGNANIYSWDFGDGKGYSNKANTLYEYEKPGYYDVTLRIYDTETGKMDEVTKQVSVDITMPHIKANFDHFDFGDGYVQFKMDTTTKVNYDVFSWDFGDRTNSNEEHPAHQYTKPGYYNVALTVKRNSDNAMHTVSKYVYVAPAELPNKGPNDKPIMSKFVSSAGTASLDVAFEDRSYGDVTSWYWDFGDNSTPATTEMPSHTYAEGGYYNVCLTVENDMYQHTDCKTVAVGNITGKHSAFYTYYIDSDNNVIDFDNKSAGDITKHFWDFGDGVTQSVEQPSHTYTKEGYYAVCLTTTSSSGNIKTYCQGINVNTTDIDTCKYNCVWPGDANNDLKADHYDILTIGLNYGMQGPIRVGADASDWSGQSSQPWANYQADSTNNMHGDCNGDGIIDKDDIEVVREFFDYSHSPSPEEFSKAGGEWSLICNVGPEIEVPTKGAATTRTVRTILSGPLDKASDNEIYGLAYDLELQGADGLDWSTVKVYFNDVFLSDTPDDLITFYTLDEAKDFIYISVCKNDQQNTPNGGNVGEIVLTFPDGDGESLVVVVTSKYGVQSDDQETGTKVPIKGGTYSSIDNSPGAEKLEVETYPNPNNGSFNVTVKNSIAGELTIEVINIVGQPVYSSSTNIDAGYSKIPVDLGDVSQGIYTVKATINGNTSLEKIVVQ